VILSLSWRTVVVVGSAAKDNPRGTPRDGDMICSVKADDSPPGGGTALDESEAMADAVGRSDGLTDAEALLDFNEYDVESKKGMKLWIAAPSLVTKSGDSCQAGRSIKMPRNPYDMGSLTTVSR
jgi:hypothetical protein